MFDRMLRYWPAISIIAVVIVSVFNIGYFAAIGYHFIGVMDLSNIAYPVGLVIAVIFGAGAFLSGNTLDTFRTIAQADISSRKLQILSKIAFIALISLFTLGLFHSEFISILGLFSLYFAIALFVSFALATIAWLRHGQLSIEWIFTLVAITLLTTSFYGGYTAQQQAYYAKTKYDFMTKSGGFHKVRIVRASSNGFLISSDRQIMFVPTSEIRLISTLGEP